MARIGIDARLTHYRTGGISTYIRRIITALEQKDMAHTLRVFQSRKATEPLSDLTPMSKLWTPPHHRLERLTLSAELMPHRLDLFHSPDFIPPLHGARKHVITVHDLTFIHYPQYLTADSRRFYNDQITRAVRQADAILSDSESTKQDMINLLNVPPEKITVHMLGVDEKFKPQSQPVMNEIRKKYNLPDTFILSVGTLEPRKNIIGLLQAYEQLYDALSDVPPLVLVGRAGWLFHETEAAIKNLKQPHQVIWLQSVSDDELPALYSAATAHITASFYEGFGLPALEAMACGTVPIVSNRSSLPEIVGDVGLQIVPEETNTITSALLKAITDDHWREQETQRGLIRARQFTWSACADIVLETYNSVL